MRNGHHFLPGAFSPTRAARRRLARRTIFSYARYPARKPSAHAVNVPALISARRRATSCW